MKNLLKRLFVLFLIASLSACTQQRDQEIEVELQMHFDNFVEEATIYGMEISINDFEIGGYVQDIEIRGTLGQCKSYSNGSKEVVIDQRFWENASHLEREYVVFHELGHCLLNRSHKDEQDANGNCISIMQSGEGDCKGSYTTQNRNSLLNELFDF